MNLSCKDTKAVLLVGGVGTRLRSVVSATPKPLAAVGGQPFLELLVRQLSSQGIRQLVMCTGYLSGAIQDRMGDGREWNVSIEYSEEPRPLGTAGAVKLAEPRLQDVEDFLVLNGDSFMEIDFGDLLRFHRQSKAIASLAVLRMKNEKRYGSVLVGAEGRVSGFAEKAEGQTGGLVSAGIYVFNHRVFEHIPAGPASLEREVFPKLLDYGVYASEQHGVFIDIGTPDDYARAQELYGRLYDTACQKHSVDNAD